MSITIWQKFISLTLAKDTKSPFEPKSDEVKIKDASKESDKADKKKDEKEESKPPVKVDIDGLQERMAGLPISAANYRNLNSVGDKLYYIRSGSKDEKAKFFFYDFEKLKENELGDFNGFEIWQTVKKPSLGQDGSYTIIDLWSTSKIEIKDKN